MGLLQSVEKQYNKIADTFSSTSKISKESILEGKALKQAKSRIIDKHADIYRTENKFSDAKEITEGMEDAAINYGKSKATPELVNRYANVLNKNDTAGNAWLKTSRAQDGMMYGDALGGALTGAATAGIGSLFTGADTGDSMMYGALTGGVGAGLMARKRSLRSNTATKNLSKAEAGLEKLNKKLGDQVLGPKSQAQIKRNNFQKAISKHQGTLNSGLSDPNFFGTGVLAGAGSLAYATLDSNRS